MSVDDAETSRALVERLKLNFPLGVDVDRSLTRAFGVHDPGNDIAWPALFLLDSTGVVRWRSLAETYPVRPAVKEVLDAADVVFGAPEWTPAGGSPSGP